MSQHYSFFFVLLLLLILGETSILISPSYFSIVPLFAIAAFILWFNFTQAYCFLFFLNHYSRLSLELGLFLTSTILMNVFDVSVWQSHLTSLIFLFGVAFLKSFLALSIFTNPPRWFSKTLLYYLFVSNAFYLIMLDYDELTSAKKNTSYLVINAFSIVLLPLIALGLAKMKIVFSKNHGAISY